MCKKIILGAAVGVLLLVGCGGGGSSDSTTPVDSMASKDAVMIIYHYPAEVCESDLLLNELQIALPEASNWLLSAESNSVTCATYGKTDGVDCTTEDYSLTDPTAVQYDTSCVVGFDIDAALLTKSSKVIGDAHSSEDIALAAEFAMDAQ